MAILTTVHHIAFSSGEVISINCPCCQTAHMERDKENETHWTCEHGHRFYVDLYQSSAKALNIRFHFLG